MRSHAVKIILMGRILEILSKHACGKARRPMTTQEIWDELEKEEFSGQARTWIRRGMISKNQVAWLLRRMLKPSVLPPSFAAHFTLPLVNKIVNQKGEAGGTKWTLACTVKQGMRT